MYQVHHSRCSPTPVPPPPLVLFPSRASKPSICLSARAPRVQGTLRLSHPTRILPMPDYSLRPYVYIPHHPIRPDPALRSSGYKSRSDPAIERSGGSHDNHGWCGLQHGHYRCVR